MNEVIEAVLGIREKREEMEFRRRSVEAAEERYQEVKRHARIMFVIQWTLIILAFVWWWRT